MMGQLQQPTNEIVEPKDVHEHNRGQQEQSNNSDKHWFAADHRGQFAANDPKHAEKRKNHHRKINKISPVTLESIFAARAEKKHRDTENPGNHPSPSEYGFSLMSHDAFLGFGGPGNSTLANILGGDIICNADPHPEFARKFRPPLKKGRWIGAGGKGGALNV